MRKDRSSMKSILEEARAMRTASLSGKNKVGVNNNSSGSKGSDFGSMPQIQSEKSLPESMANSNNAHQMRHSFQIHQKDSSNNHPRYQQDLMNRGYFDNDSHLLNMSQQEHFSPHFIMNLQSQQFRRPSIEELTFEALGKINQLICMDYKPSNKMNQIKEKLESCLLLENKNVQKFKLLVSDFGI